MTLTQGGAVVMAKVFTYNKLAFKRKAARFTSRLSAVPAGMINDG